LAQTESVGGTRRVAFSRSAAGVGESALECACPCRRGPPTQSAQISWWRASDRSGFACEVTRLSSTLGTSFGDAGERLDAEPDVFERPLPKGRGIEAHALRQHIERYRWSSTLARGRILDAACGTGYGSALLTETCSSVVGIDCDMSAVTRARTRAPEASIVQGELPECLAEFDACSFDTIVSFETIEHVGRDAHLLAEFRRLVTPNGMLLLSTPNAIGPLATPDQRDAHPENPFHVREYTIEELTTLLHGSGFEITVALGQNSVRLGRGRSLCYRAVARFPSLCRPGSFVDGLVHGTEIVARFEPDTRPWIFVLQCAPARRAGVE
jgi:SAM-dependent methyltransferase